MKKIIIYIFILIILVITFFILNFYSSNNKILEDVTILGLWNDIKAKNEYEITLQNPIKIDVFTTINNMYKKISPGSSGSFTIKFKRPLNVRYKINIIEKTAKPKNLVFILGNKEYKSLDEMEVAINECFINKEKLTINWEWKYYINEIHDKQDTKDGEKAKRYLFEVSAIIEEERI